jgi:hypothetical protein
MFGSPSQGLQQSIGFNISNNLEMKVKSKSDSTGVKKVKIFETLNVSGGYNFAAEKYKWSVISVSTQTSFFQNKLSVNSSMSIDPYQIIFAPGETTGTRTENFGHFSVQSFTLGFSVPLTNELFGKKEDLSKKYKQKAKLGMKSIILMKIIMPDLINLGLLTLMQTTVILKMQPNLELK